MKERVKNGVSSVVEKVQDFFLYVVLAISLIIKSTKLRREKWMLNTEKDVYGT